MCEQDYGNGLFKATNDILNYCNKRIAELKSVHPEKNTTDQIFASGQLKAYHKLIVKLESKRRTIIQQQTIKKQNHE